jgi:hypothetical protein
VTKVGKAWSWLAARVKGSESSTKAGPPYKQLPPLPEPKTRPKARYSVVLIGEGGSTHQFAFTPFRVSMALGILGTGAVVFVVALALGLGALRSGAKEQARQDPAASEQLDALQEALRQKDLEVGVLEKRVKELQERPTLASAAPVAHPAVEEPATPSLGSRAVRVEGPPASIQGSDRVGSLSAPTASPVELPREPAEPPAAAGPTARSPLYGAPAPSPAPTSPGARPAVTVNFNARDLTAVSEGPASGKLTFRLVKDQTDIRFSGYLFVYVEMTDPRGEKKTYAYPERTRTGEEDLPLDFREGKGVSFKQNFQGELTYADTRQSAELSQISVLLYSEDGSIVFQRGFGPREFKHMSSKEGESPRTKARDRRRAL